MKNSSIVITAISALFLAFQGSEALAQQSGAGDADLEIVNLELSKSTPASRPAPTQTTSDTTEPAAAPPDLSADEKQALEDEISFEGLGRLSSFKEISVIQKRFLPKTQRFEANLSLAMVTNNPFFDTFGASLRLGYNFTEDWGVELQGMALSTSQKQTTKELKEIQGVKTESLSYAKTYFGGDIKWSPFYGKMSYLNSKIVPFDLFLLLGAGTTITNLNESAPSFHAGLGQTFAVSKGQAFRWDFGGNFFQATGIDGAKGSFNNLFINVGYSWFFPEAKYR